MKPTLQVRLSQHLALTPQLQQSIRLLQLSTLELHQARRLGERHRARRFRWHPGAAVGQSGGQR
jgi:hypothetical protein